jgi:hypothetical protein
VVTGGAAECVVVGGGADVVVDDAVWVMVVAAGVDLCAVAFLCAGAAFFVVVLVVVVELVFVCGVDAAGVEVVWVADVPPQPATARAVAIVLSSARFMDPASILARRLPVPGYKTPGMPQRCGGGVGVAPVHNLPRPSPWTDRGRLCNCHVPKLPRSRQDRSNGSLCTSSRVHWQHGDADRRFSPTGSGPATQD